jgi:hypothetical protein
MGYFVNYYQTLEIQGEIWIEYKLYYGDTELEVKETIIREILDSYHGENIEEDELNSSMKYSEISDVIEGTGDIINRISDPYLDEQGAFDFYSKYLKHLINTDMLSGMNNMSFDLPSDSPVNDKIQRFLDASTSLDNNVLLAYLFKLSSGYNLYMSPDYISGFLSNVIR